MCLLKTSENDFIWNKHLWRRNLGKDLEKDYPGLGWALNLTTSVLTRDTKGDTWRHTEKNPREEVGGRDCRDAATSQGTKDGQPPPEARRGMVQILPQSLHKEPTLQTRLF